jgi:hypothetical protein
MSRQPGVAQSELEFFRAYCPGAWAVVFEIPVENESLHTGHDDALMPSFQKGTHAFFSRKSGLDGIYFRKVQ